MARECLVGGDSAYSCVLGKIITFDIPEMAAIAISVHYQHEKSIGYESELKKSIQ